MPINSTLAQQTINDFLTNRELSSYKTNLHTLLSSYVTTEEYVSLDQDDRIDIVDSVNEVIDLIDKMITIGDKSAQEDSEEW